jgi:hypothetical protein
MMPIEATPPPTPLIPRRLLDPINNVTNDFQKMNINTNLPLTPPRSADVTNTNWSLGTSSNEIRNNHSLFSRINDTTPKTTTSANLLTPTSIDRYLTGHRRLSDSTFTSSTSALFSKIQQVDHFSFFSTGSSTRYAISWYNSNKSTSTSFSSTY